MRSVHGIVLFVEADKENHDTVIDVKSTKQSVCM